MSIQGYDKAFQNAVTSFNAKMRAVCTAIPVLWLPNGKRPKTPTYPFVTAQFLRIGTWDTARFRLRSRLQIDVFSNDAGPAEARRMSGKVMSGLGFSMDTYYMMAEIPQIDSESTPAIPLLPMDLEYVQGFEDFGDTDPNVTHLMAEFNLYHE